LGLVPRLAFVHAFPTRPVSDFQSIVEFALYLRDHSWITNGWYWEYFSPGLPVVLSVLFRIFPGSPDDAARLATAVVCGLMPLLPFVIWRGVTPLWVRTLAGTMLAAWPGQVLFSGVVAQDNWVLPPAVALGALAARALIARHGGYPVAAGLLFAFGVAMRQEMLIALLPLLAGGAGLGSPAGRRWRNVALVSLAAGLPLLGLAVHRGLATGRYALTSEHGGMALLGSYIPGASVNFWTDPLPFVATAEPALLRDPDLASLHRSASRLALREALRRPGFHAARITASVLKHSVDSEGDNLYWSVGHADTLPEPARARGQAVMKRLGEPLYWEMLLVLALFLAAVALAIRRRDAAVLALAAAILLKVGLHGVVVVQSRYMLAATALAILAVALGAWTAVRGRALRPVLMALGAGAAGSLAIALSAPPALAWVRTHDRQEAQLTYRFPAVRFPMATWGSEAVLDCVVERGLVASLNPVPALRTLHQDPAPGEAATADCTLAGPSRSPLALRLHDPYALGGLPGRMVQRVEVDGAEVFRHDLAAEAGTGWAEIPLGILPRGARKRIRIEILAIRPDPGAAWGNAASTEFELVKEKP